jgi:antitoxin (DNA-binding transcriptional repressor) of toxin-antitoxin stability system
MKTISKRELNQQTAQVLAGIDPGETVLVTERGVPRWRIEAIDALSDPVERLRAQGRIRSASPNPPPWPKGRYSPTERKAQYTPADVDALYEDMRDDR